MAGQRSDSSGVGGRPDLTARRRAADRTRAYLGTVTLAWRFIISMGLSRSAWLLIAAMIVVPLPLIYCVTRPSTWWLIFGVTVLGGIGGAGYQMACFNTLLGFVQRGRSC